MARPTLRAAFAIVPLLILVAASVYSLAVQRAEMRQNPSDSEWAAAQAVVRQHFGPNDILRSAPHWADQARAGLYELPFNHAIDLEEAELYAYDNLWIIADREHADQAVTDLPAGWTLAEAFEPAERVRVFRIDIPPPDHVLLDVTRDIARARVTREYGDGRVEVCDHQHEGGWHCGRPNPWLHVTPSLEEVGNSLRHCLYIGLPPDAEQVVAFDDVVLGDRLAGDIGNTMPAIRAERGSAIDFRIEIDGQVRHQHTFGKWVQPLQPFDVDTSDLADTPHDLRFVVHAAEFYDRWVCLRARALRDFGH